MPRNEIVVRQEAHASGVEVKIEIETWPSADSKSEARRVLRKATNEALILLGGEPLTD